MMMTTTMMMAAYCKNFVSRSIVLTNAMHATIEKERQHPGT